MSAIRAALAIALAVGGTIALASCAPSRSQQETSERPPRPSTRRSNVLISREELQGSTAIDTYQAVQMLRPDWLRGRGPTSLSGGVPEVLVYVDGQRMGGRAILTQYPVNSVREIRFHNATDATQRWGTGHAGGVIELIIR